MCLWCDHNKIHPRHHKRKQFQCAKIKWMNQDLSFYSCSFYWYMHNQIIAYKFITCCVLFLCIFFFIVIFSICWFSSHFFFHVTIANLFFFRKQYAFVRKLKFCKFCRVMNKSHKMLVLFSIRIECSIYSFGMFMVQFFFLFLLFLLRYPRAIVFGMFYVFFLPVLCANAVRKSQEMFMQTYTSHILEGLVLWWNHHHG